MITAWSDSRKAATRLTTTPIGLGVM
jgi:hypothetical protein